MPELKVWKYPVPFEDEFELDMPDGAELLHFGNQFEKGQLWALVDPSQPLAKRTFRVAGTGHSMDGGLYYYYIGTAQFGGGALIFHLFETRRYPAI